jgi:multicomponent K+:H+ antiporter subunit E
MKAFVVLLALWLVLNESLAPGHVAIGAAIAALGVASLRRLQAEPFPARRPRAALRLLVRVIDDVIRSNVAVARIVLGFGRATRTAGFLPVLLDLRAPAGLAVLACIVTATPGTSWVRYDRGQNLLTLHVLDLTDPQALAGEIKQRYERLLMEIFE